MDMDRDSDETGTVRESEQKKLQRLQSLLFGAEIALANVEDEEYLKPLLRQAYQKIDSAQDATMTDSQALELAKCKQGFVFGGRRRPIDVEAIKGSKYYRPLLSEEKSVLKTVELASQPPAAAKVEREFQAAASPWKVKKPLLQSKLVTLYGSLKVESSTRGSVHDVQAGKVTGNGSNGGARSSGARACLDGYDDLPHSSTKGRPTHQIKPQECSVSDFMPPHEEEEEDVVLANRRANRKRAGNPSLLSHRLDKARAVAKEDSSEDEVVEAPTKNFMTANQKLVLDGIQNRAGSQQGGGNSAGSYRGSGIKTLGLSRRGVRSGFVPPVRCSGSTGGGASGMYRSATDGDGASEDSARQCLELLVGPDGEVPERLRNLEPKLIEHVSNEIMNRDPNVRWDDVAGLEHAKKCVTEMVIWPLKRPDIFQGCRSPGKGLLLFGPPGTGKTMIGKAIAGEANATFFSISASSLTSKWIGEGEKLVRALFGVASCRQPAVIFIDEIDSLLSQRKAEGEHESSRRLKTQFLIEMEGCGSSSEQVLLIGATNRPQELDEAARRRLSRRLYIPLPSAAARGCIVRRLLEKDKLLTLSDEEIDTICSITEGYSGSDMKNLVKEASMGPLREALMQGKDIGQINKEEMRQITLEDFNKGLQQVKPSVSPDELVMYEDWNRQFGGLTL